MSALEDLAAGQSADQLIPGDVTGLEQLVTGLESIATQLIDTGNGINYIELDGESWSGQAANVYAVVKDADAASFKNSATVFDDVQAAVQGYLSVLKDSRRAASVAVSDYAAGKKKQQADIDNCTPPPPPTNPLTPYDPYGLDAAAGKVTEARASVATAAKMAAPFIKEAAGYAPTPPQVPTGDTGGGFGDLLKAPWHVLAGFGKGMAGALTSLPDDFSPPGAPMYGTGEQGRQDALDGFNESFDGSAALIGAGLMLAGARGGEENPGAIRSFLSKYLKSNKGLADEAVTTRPWKVGDPIDALTAKGTDPAWTTVRTRYWKNEAAGAEPGEYSPSDMARMEQGKPPQHPQIGVSKELDHILQRNAGGTHAPDNLREVWPWEHDALDPYRHYTGPRPEGFDPDQFRSAHQ